MPLHSHAQTIPANSSLKWDVKWAVSSLQDTTLRRKRTCRDLLRLMTAHSRRVQGGRQTKRHALLLESGQAVTSGDQCLAPKITAMSTCHA